MAPAEKSGSSGEKVLATNRKAFRDYIILDKLEAGIELRGSEVKSIRSSRFSLNESYALIDRGQALLLGMNILPYEYSRVEEHKATRPKRLLLHRQQIDRLTGQTAIQGHTLIPLRLYLKHGLVKIELAVCKGKHAEDKRETMRRRTAEREAERAMASRTRR